jgi:type IV pili sensor histidine kinase/response regulator
MKILLLPLLLLPLLAHAELTIIDEPIPPSSASPAQVEARPLPTVQIRPMPEIWIGEESSTLRESLETWAKKAGWLVIWDKNIAEIDYPLLASVQFQGTFDEAASAFISLYKKARIPLLLDIQLSQKLIHITRRP